MNGSTRTLDIAQAPCTGHGAQGRPKCEPAEREPAVWSNGRGNSGASVSMSRAPLLAICVVLAIFGPAAAATTLFTNARIHPVSSPAIENGQLLIDGDKIVAVGTDLAAQAGDAAVVDLQGQWLTPAFMTANTVMGLSEIETVRGSVDVAEIGAVNPNARAEVAINADSENWGVARANGVLYAHVVPQVGQGGVISGSSALVQLSGWTWEQMTVQAPVGTHLMWPSTRLPPWLPAPMRDEALKGSAAAREAIDRAFDDAAAYAAAKRAGTLEGVDARWEAMLAVLDGRQRLFVHAVDLKQIREAIDFAAERKLKITLVGAQDAWRLRDEIKAADIGVILHGPFGLPLRRHEAYDANYRNAAQLAQAGIRFAIASDGTTFAASLERNLAHAAGHAVGFGLTFEQGLAAITLAPAQLLGVDDRLGSLEPGKLASFVVFNGDPLEVRSQLTAAYLNGEPVDLSSRHTRLRDKFQQKYE